MGSDSAAAVGTGSTSCGGAASGATGGSGTSSSLTVPVWRRMRIGIATTAMTNISADAS
jgi:hypothetical protein